MLVVVSLAWALSLCQPNECFLSFSQFVNAQVLVSSLRCLLPAQSSFLRPPSCRSFSLSIFHCFQSLTFPDAGIHFLWQLVSRIAFFACFLHVYLVRTFMSLHFRDIATRSFIKHYWHSTVFFPINSPPLITQLKPVLKVSASLSLNTSSSSRWYISASLA